MNEPLISIIVPAYNSKKTIKKCIESLLVINYQNYEIIIVDDGSTDNTKEILSEYKDRIHIIENQHSGPSKCRNIAANRVKGDFLAFTDADCLADRDWLKELIKGFINDEVVSVGGSQLSPQDETNFGKRVQEFFELTGFLGGYIKTNQKPVTSNQGNVKKEARLVGVPHNPSCNSMYRKDAFSESGGFDDNLWPGEDVDLDYRLKKKGFIFICNSKAIVYHYRPQSIKELSKMMFRYGINQGILTKRYGIFRRIQIIPIIFILLILLVFVNPYWLVVLLLLYFYLLFKLKSISKANSVLFLSIFSLFSWTFGFARGLLKFKI